MSSVQRFTFQCREDLLVGALHRPPSEPRACVVLSGPLTSVKEQAAGAYAATLAARGYAALAFDHRTFGESEGSPRQLENPFAKVQDIRAAAAALHAEMPSQPVLGIGVCAGGGYMARAVAEDALFSGFAGVAGVYGTADAASIARAEPAIARARAAEQKWRETGVAETIPAVGPDNGDVAMPLTEAYAYYGTARGAVPNYANAYAVQSSAYTLTFDAQGAAPLIEVPTVIVHSEKALAPAWARAFITALAAPHEAVWLGSEGQIDFYDDPKLVGSATDAIDAFFERHQVVPRSAERFAAAGARHSQA
jgi:uncharacterized protein